MEEPFPLSPNPLIQLARKCALRSVGATLGAFLAWNSSLLISRRPFLASLMSTFSPWPWLGLAFFCFSMLLFLVGKLLLMEPTFGPTNFHGAGNESGDEFGGESGRGKYTAKYAQLLRFMRCSSFVILSALVAWIGYNSSTWFLLKSSQTLAGRIPSGSLLLFGLIYGFQHIYRNRFVLNFPVFQRPFPVRLMHCISDAASHSFFSAIAFFLFTLFFRIPSESFFDALHIAADSFINLSFVSFVLELNCHVFEISFTEIQIFRIQNSENDIRSLHSFMENSDVYAFSMYFKYLSAMEICYLSTTKNPVYISLVFRDVENYARLIYHCCDIINNNMMHISALLRNKEELHPTDFTIQYMEAFRHIKLCEWCALIISSLSIQSIEEDVRGIEQQAHTTTLSISTLLSAIIHLEQALQVQLPERKTSFSAPLHPFPFLVPLLNETRFLQIGGIYEPAFILNDVFKTQLYNIVDRFQEAGLLSEPRFLNEESWHVAKKYRFGGEDVRKHKLSCLVTHDEIDWNGNSSEWM